MSVNATLEALRGIWPSLEWTMAGEDVCVRTPPQHLRAVVRLLDAHEWRLATIVASDRGAQVDMRYCFYALESAGWIHLLTSVDARERTLPSITPVIIAADWFEREIEDLFSIHFTDHPRLGDFVLHDDTWAEGVTLMRKTPQEHSVTRERRPWIPLRVLREEGAFAMPIGPVFSGENESALFLLETVGEDVVRAIPRLFFKYRAIEKLAEGRSAQDVLLLAERCAGTSAIGNGWAYCRAVERALDVAVPPRALALRAFFAELERMRHHVTSIRQICGSTALIVSEAQALWLEEQLLRISGELAGHRYLFGVLALGGVGCDVAREDAERALRELERLATKIDLLGHRLADSSSFLDRIERVGMIDRQAAWDFGLLGPLARASGLSADLRAVQPYAPYPSVQFAVPIEREGDGYARLRVLFAETHESLRILRELLEQLPDGDVRTPFEPHASCALGWTEAPRGAAIHWVELGDDGTVLRYRLTPPSARNWHGFHVATEGFSFQDFPIVLATLDLSVAENDR